MKKLAILILPMLFFSCLSTGPGQLKEKDLEKYVYILGKLDTGIDLEKALKTKSKNLYVRMLMHIDPDGIAGSRGQRFYGYHQEEEYFLMKVKREELYLIQTVIYPKVSVGGGAYLTFDFHTAINYEDSDQLIYIGDLSFVREGEKSYLQIDDNYDAALDRYSEYLKGVDGTYIIPEKRLVEGGSEIIDRAGYLRVYSH